MKPILLIDFGSTYTKLTAVDVDAECLLGTAASYTTVQTDINEGLELGLKLLEEKTGKLTFDKCYACSSAAGGLRMITSGLVPELTGEAAKLASLGAGAKVVGLYSFQLTEDDLENISGFPRTIAGVKIAATLREEPNGRIKMSVRAVPGYDAAAICEKFGGGGHKGAAGASMDLTMDEAVAAVKEAMPTIV